MPCEARILPDMLLTVFKKGYFFYIIALCYVIIALMSAFCLHCHTTKQRIKRESSMPCVEYCFDCSPGGICRNCSGGRMFFVYERNNKIVAECAHSCPRTFHTRYSKLSPSTCTPCRNRYCESCDGSSSRCALCSRKSFLHKGTCLKNCPKGFRRNKRKRRCTPRKVCLYSPWVKTTSRKCSCKDGMWKKIIKTRKIIKGGKKCRRTFRSKLCHAPFGRKCPSSSDSETNIHGNQKPPTLNDSRNPLLLGNTTQSKQHIKQSLNNYKDPRHSTHSRNKRLISIMTYAT